MYKQPKNYICILSFHLSYFIMAYIKTLCLALNVQYHIYTEMQIFYVNKIRLLNIIQNVFNTKNIFLFSE